MSTATSGQISPMQPVFQNYTYNQQFHAPALRCFGANESIVNNLTISVENETKADSLVFFMAFTPNSEVNLGAPNDLTKWEDATVYSLGMDTVSEDVFRLFIVPDAAAAAYHNNSTFWDETIECNLMNASYTTSVTFQDGSQNINLSRIDLLNEVAPVLEISSNTSHSPPYVNQTESNKASYNGIMLAFTRMLVGYKQLSAGAEKTINTNYDMTLIDWTQPNSSIKGLEQLFQNITLSALSVPDLIQNETRTDKIPVEIVTYPLAYSFDPKDIVIAYGLTFAISFTSVIFAILAVISHSGSYSNIFSTFVRVTRGASLDFGAQAGLDDGKDPLPKTTGETKIRLANVEDRRLAQMSRSSEASMRDIGRIRQSHTV